MWSSSCEAACHHSHRRGQLHGSGPGTSPGITGTVGTTHGLLNFAVSHAVTCWGLESKVSGMLLPPERSTRKFLAGGWLLFVVILFSSSSLTSSIWCDITRQAETQTALVADPTELRWTDSVETSAPDQRLTSDGRVGRMPNEGVSCL